MKSFGPQNYVKTKKKVQTSSSAQMQTIVKLLGGMQSNYWGDISPLNPPRVSAPLITHFQYRYFLHDWKSLKTYFWWLDNLAMKVQIAMAIFSFRKISVASARTGGEERWCSADTLRTTRRESILCDLCGRLLWTVPYKIIYNNNDVLWTMPLNREQAGLQDRQKSKRRNAT